MVRKRNRRIVKNQKKLSYAFNGRVKKKMKNKGWRGESRRHSEASVKGWNSRFGKKTKYSLSQVKKRNSKRTLRARTLDSQKNTRIVGKNRYSQWMKNPNRFDIEGIDTKKSKNPKTIRKKLPVGWNESDINTWQSSDKQQMVHISTEPFGKWQVLVDDKINNHSGKVFGESFDSKAEAKRKAIQFMESLNHIARFQKNKFK